VARRATLIQRERAAAKDGGLLLLDAGDSLTGDREPAIRTKGATSVDLMNRMGYDAIVLGPADLSLGPETVKQRIAEAKFAVLAADVTDAISKQPVAKPYVIKETGGQRVAITGLSGAPDKNGFKVADGYETVKAVVQELQGQADAIILLSHAPRDVNQRIADEVPGIAAIIEGGADVRIQPWVSKTGVPLYHADGASSGHAGRMVGVGQLQIEAGKPTNQTWRVVSLGPEIPDDAAMAQWVQQNY
jgi:2',3'-cyclic-nucleotide 2'-phosphodiesterase (5'-nucleotidase family)